MNFSSGTGARYPNEIEFHFAQSSTTYTNGTQEKEIILSELISFFYLTDSYRFSVSFP